MKGLFTQQLCNSGRDNVRLPGLVFNLREGGALLVIAVNTPLGLIDGDLAFDVILGGIQQIGRGEPALQQILKELL